MTDLFPSQPTDQITTRRERLIYAAGLFDGEGYVGIQLRTPMRKRKPHVTVVTLVMHIHMATPWGPQWMADLFGGRVYLYAGKRQKQDGSPERPLYRWRLVCGKAARALTELRPFLREKAMQADLCLEARRIQTSRPYGTGAVYRPEDRARVTEIHAQVKALKRA